MVMDRRRRRDVLPWVTGTSATVVLLSALLALGRAPIASGEGALSALLPGGSSTPTAIGGPGTEALSGRDAALRDLGMGTRGPDDPHDDPVGPSRDGAPTGDGVPTDRGVAREPFWPGSDPTQIRLAAAVLETNPGEYLSAEDGRAFVAEAEHAIADVLALGGDGNLTVANLERAANMLGVAFDTDSPLAGVTTLATRAKTRTVAALAVLGVEPPAEADRDQLVAAAVVAHGLVGEPNTLLRELATATQLRAAPLRIRDGGLGAVPVVPVDMDELGRLVGLPEPTSDLENLAITRRAAEIRRTSPLQIMETRVLHGSVLAHTLVWQTGAGPVRAELVTVRPDDPSVKITTDWASGPSSRANVQDAARARGALVAVNGGFWVSSADPDGLLIRDGAFLSDTSAGVYRVNGIRSGFAVGPSGAVVGYPELTMTLGDASSGRTRVFGLNRRSDIAPNSSGDLVLHTPDGPYRPTRIASGQRVLQIDPTGPVDVARAIAEGRDVPATITEVPAGGLGAVPTSSTLLVASGRYADRVLGMVGEDGLLDVSLSPRFAGMQSGLTGGPLLLREGKLADRAVWVGEGFDRTHTDARHPRTAVGVDAHGTLMLLTVDGRSSRSVGLTQAATAKLLAALGAVDATMLDGGGSAQMVIGGELANRPCCDQPTRAVATVVMILPAG